MSRTLRILMTADTVGGVWTYAMELCRALTRGGASIALATMGRRLSSSQRSESESVPGTEIFESSYKLEWMADPWEDVRQAGEWLLNLEEAFQPDIVHLNSFPHGALPFHAPKIVVGHSCVLSWWRAVHGQDAPREWDAYRSAVRDGLHGSNLVVAPSEAMRRKLCEHYGPLPNSAVIPNARRPLFRPLSKEPFIISAGRLWDAAKNVATLAKAAPGLGWPTYVAGETRNPGGPAVEYPGVRGLGQLSAQELQYWFGHASIYAAAARYEPFGLSILEAAQAGCALVLGDIPSLRENWDGAALFVSPGDANELHDALTHLICDQPLRSGLAAAARERAAQFTPEKMAAEYRAAYQAAGKLQRTREPSLCES